MYIRFLCRKTWDNQLHLRSSYAHRITISFSYTCPYSIQTNFIEKMKKKKKLDREKSIKVLFKSVIVTDFLEIFFNKMFVIFMCIFLHKPLFSTVIVILTFFNEIIF